MAINSAYNKPDVTVIQEITSPTTVLAEPSLYACVIGQCFQVEKNTSAGYYDGTSEAFEYPGLMDGAVVDQSSVVVKVIKNDQTNTLPSSDYTVDGTAVTLNPDIIVLREITDAVGIAGDTTASALLFKDADAEFVSWGIEPGDILTILGTGLDAGDHTVASVDSETQITLDATFTATDINLDYMFTQVDYIGEGVGSLVEISYRALRSDLQTVGIIESESDLTAQLGLSVSANPLALGAKIMLQNSATMLKYVAVQADSLSEHELAAEKLSTEEVYSIAPLTQKKQIIEMWKTHVYEMSQPEEKMERCSVTNIKLPLRRVRTNMALVDASSAGTNLYYIDKVGAAFQSDGVINGDIVYFATVDETSDVSALDGYVVRSVVSETRIKVYSEDVITGSHALLSVCSKEHTKTEQAKHVRDYASSLEEKRVTLLQPDEVEMIIDEVTEVVPGYYLSAAYAAAMSAYPSQQGFTGIKLSGFARLRHSNLGYFTKSQLNTMASGGVAILVQETSDADPEVRHQLTTDVRTIEARELSLVKNPDLIAKFIRNVIRPLIGKYNITKFFMEMLRVSLESVFELLKDSTGAIGPHILSATVVSIEQNQTQPDRVDIIIDLEIPFPANDIRITIRI